jgi:DNA processing protein
MKFTDNVLNVIAAKAYRGIGRAWIVKNLKGNESAARLVALLNQGAKEGRLISIHEFEERKQSIRSQFEQLERVVDGVVAVGDSNFPLYRGVVKNSEKPVALFYRGDLRLLEKQNKNVTVIGLLNPDEDTEVFEKRVVSSLVSYGVTIVSGLALGCDSVAHEQALLSGGKTVAILPSPITDILPQGNKELAEEIVQKDGLLISEYYEKANSKMELSGRYQERDRLQALFSDCVVLSASYAENDLGNDSGSRHAMNYAQSYSISRAIMYDSKLNAGNLKYDLNRQLIREDNSVIVITRDNVQETLKEILSGHAESPGKNWVQKDLFG